MDAYKEEKEENVFLVKNTFITKDEDTYIIYNPFSGSIVRVHQFPSKNSSIYTKLSENGFFGELPETTKEIESWSSFSSLTLLLTRKCNLKCIYCYASGGLSGESMPVQLAIDSINWFFQQTEVKDTKIAFHGGGEPTLVENLIRSSVRYIDKIRDNCSVKYLITTNGTAHCKFMNWMIDHDFGISISIDGPPEIQNRNRPFINGSGSSDIVERNIRLLVKKEKPFSIRITYSARDNLSSIVKYFGELGVKNIHLEPLFPYGRDYHDVEFGPDSKYEIYSSVGQELANSFLRALEVCKSFGIRVRNSHFIHFTNGISYFCGSVSGKTMLVTHDGLITSCLEVVDSKNEEMPDFCIGKWQPESKTFLIDKNRIKSFLSRHVNNLNECKECFARYVCAGGCAIKAYRATGKLFSKDVSYCEFTRILVPKLIKRIAVNSKI